MTKLKLLLRVVLVREARRRDAKGMKRCDEILEKEKNRKSRIRKSVG